MRRVYGAPHIFETNHHPPLVAVAYGGMECRARSPALSEGFLNQARSNERGRNQMSYDPGAIMDTLRKEGVKIGDTFLFKELSKSTYIQHMAHHSEHSNVDN